MSNNVIYKTYHYTYWITNTKLHKHYIGVRTSKISPIHDLGVKYFSSSLDEEFMEDQKSNQIDYEYRVIGVFTTRKEASKNEIELHETYGVGRNPKFYNQCKATSSGFDRSEIKHTEKSRKKMSVSKKNMSDETKDKMSVSQKNKEPDTEETKKKKSDAHKNRPPFTEEHKKNLSDACKNRPPFTEEHKKNLSDAAKNRTDETRKKMSDSQLGKKRGKYKPKS
jgi:hypothetical protein